MGELLHFPGTPETGVETWSDSRLIEEWERLDLHEQAQDAVLAETRRRLAQVALEVKKRKQEGRPYVPPSPDEKGGA